MLSIIVNADDFGASSEINAAVIQALDGGILTSASLMVTGGAFEEAVSLARDAPALAVGLHLVLVNGRPALPPPEVPRLAGPYGLFRNAPVWAGLQYALDASARRELARELSAQFERFAATGLQLSHVDSHMHFHIIPAVFDLLLPLASQYGATAIRVPRDDLRRAASSGQRRIAGRAVLSFIFWVLNRRCVHKLQPENLRVADRVYGLFQSGRMSEAYVVEVLEHLEAATAELYFHPTIADEAEPLGPNRGDLDTLLSPKVQSVIEARGIRLTTFPALDGGR